VIEQLRHAWLRIRLFFGSIRGLRCEGRGIGREGALIVWVCDHCGEDVTNEVAW